MKKMTMKEYEQSVDDGYIVSTIHCSFCDNDSKLLFTDGDIEDYTIYYDQGWRNINSKSYCPDCAKKKLKNDQ